jgi:hypothetical protein
MRNYCGGILEKTMPMHIELVPNNGYYGGQNLYCHWTARVYDKATLINLNFTKHPILPGNDIFMVQTHHSNGEYYNNTIEPKSYILDAYLLTELTVHYLSTSSVSIRPFQIDISQSGEGSTNLIGVYISIGVVVLICIIMSILFYRCSKAILIGNRRAQDRVLQQMMNQQTIVQPISEDEEKKLHNRNLLDQLFMDDLKPVWYRRELNEFNTPNCTICLEGFANNKEVVKLYCKHVFHYKCLKDWLEKILLDPKCPICNDHVIQEEGAPHNNTIVATGLDNSRRDLLILGNNINPQSVQVTEASSQPRPNRRVSYNNYIDMVDQNRRRDGEPGVRIVRRQRTHLPNSNHSIDSVDMPNAITERRELPSNNPHPPNDRRMSLFLPT